MDIASEKRDENIAEYILYIWQLEDLMRAMRFGPEAVFAALVAPRDASDEWKSAAMEWYMDIARLLEREGKAEVGHLDHTLHLVADLNDLHLTLLQQPAGREYRELFARLEPELPHLRVALGREDISDIELSFRALYAAMLYRMRGVKGEVTDGVVTLISPVVAALSDIYHKVERGEMDVYRE
ncbi:MAG: DUF4924 family protein [Alistipes sp.]|jgi:hypothetical protein|nr:DUF4924 family protein [Alistipes sp.]